MTQEQAASVRQLLSEGLRSATIAKRLGLTKELVDNMLKTLGE